MAEAPILYLEVPSRLAISEDLAARMDAFLRAGGTLVVQSVPNDRPFAEQLAKYFRGVFKGLRSAPLKADHPVFRARYAVPAVEGFALGDALRTRVFLFVGDLSGPAHRGPDNDALPVFQTWADLLEYATDGRPLPGRLAAARPPPPPPATVRNLAVARLRYRGEWDLCPGAMKRLGEVLAGALSVGVEEQAVEPAQAASCKAPLLWVVGAGAAALAPREVAQLREYVRGGGTVFIDSTAGSEEFLLWGRGLAKDLTGRDAEEVPAGHPLLSGRFAGGAGNDCSTVAYSPAAARKIGSPRGRAGLLGASLNGRLAVVLCPYSVSCPLEGNPTYGLVGLAVPDARRLAANLVLYAAFKPRSGPE
jgi:hypothetical protein